MQFQNLGRKHYFEGWYYKQVSADEKTVLCFIPGVSVSDSKKSYFIQVILAEKTDTDWQQTTDWLDIVRILMRKMNRSSIQLDGSRFYRNGLSVSIRGNRIQVSGELRFHGLIALPASPWAPTVMGPFSYLPGMECIHSVISLSHGIEGAYWK